jgi:hypothetical protein
MLAEVEALKSACEALHEGLEGETDPARTAAANKLFLRVARVLNPVFYQTGSDFAHDPALGSRSIPSLAPALDLPALDPASDEFRFNRTGLIRRMNRVRHQIREAAALVAAFRAGA